VTAAVTLLVLLVAFAGTMAVQAQRITRERDRANHEAATAQQVSDFLTGLFTVSDPSEARGNTLTAREILDKGAAKIEADLAGQPVVRARLMVTIGGVYVGLGLYGAAAPLLERAVAIDRNALGSDDPQTLAAVHALANVFWFQGRWTDAEALYLDVVTRRHRLLGDEHPDTLRANYDLGSLYAVQRRWPEAETIDKITLDRQRRVLGIDHTDTLGTMGNLASLYYAQRRFEESLALAEEVTRLRHARFGDDDPRTLNGMHNVATNYDQLGRYSEAEAMYRRTIAGRTRVLGPSHPLTVTTARRLAAMYEKQQRYPEAESQLLMAFEHLTHAPAAEPRSIQSVVGDLANLYDAWGKPMQAAEWRGRLSTNTAKPSR
jgi:non-specific serine/threonine protein kinase/serine/threonine-protein kinase